MFQTLGIAIALTAVLFIAYLVMKAYFPTFLGNRKRGAAVPIDADLEEPFQASPPTQPTKVNTPAPPVPAAAPPQYQDPPMEERQISPGGPSTPAVAAPRITAPSISPEAKPIDPYEDANMEAPIHDSVRYPEMSFGPGVDNSGMNKLALSGVGSSEVGSASSPFSPEFAQNGASFMGEVTANDLQPEDSYGAA